MATFTTRDSDGSTMRREESTGLGSLDSILTGLRAGDNVVWRVDSVEQYVPFTSAFLAHARRIGERIMYFRFADHAPVLPVDDPNVDVHETHPSLGFENFITEIHRIITAIGVGGYYVFDSLSDLSHTCYSDRMIGNFFRLTCPYLRRLDTIAYFAMYRYVHSYHATVPIGDTTQILLDVYSHRGVAYLQPRKVEGRSSATMYGLHRRDGDDFLPVTESSVTARVVASSPWPGLPSASYRMVGVWDKVFLKAEAVLEQYERGEIDEDACSDIFSDVVALVITREQRMRALAEKFFSLADIVSVWKRMIGTGMIGGKSVGMLLARAILHRRDAKWDEVLELHDSFFIGSDVYYTFLVNNDCWWERQRQKDPATFLDGNDAVRARMLAGRFPEYIVRRFTDMLEYYGEVPIIVRSSSLLEDNFGNAFAGKYDSEFCINRGPLERRLERFLDAVRRIYASTISDEALNYRKTRGVLDRDEQMALLVQRVSGSPNGGYFLPHLAGVAFSFNPYAWNTAIDPSTGMMRIVTGLGTRAVDRSDDDYTRIVALNAPELRPESSFDEVRKHSQRRVDVLDLEKETFTSLHFLDLVESAPGLPIERFASRDVALERQMRQAGTDRGPIWVPTFVPVFTATDFVPTIREMLSTVREAYGSEVDIEFTANLERDGRYTINLVQCRPLAVHGADFDSAPVPDIPDDAVVLKSHGGVIGHTRTISIARVVYIPSRFYSALPEPRRYLLARAVGRVVRACAATDALPGGVMLLGPGRWGTSTPSLGVPVTFSEINTVAVMCEIDTMHEGLVADLSLGTHFFNEMVEADLVYIAHFSGMDGNVFREDVLLAQENTLERLAPEDAGWAQCIRVVDAPPGGLHLHANAKAQTAILYTSP